MELWCGIASWWREVSGCVGPGIWKIMFIRNVMIYLHCLHQLLSPFFFNLFAFNFSIFNLSLGFSILSHSEPGGMGSVKIK